MESEIRAEIARMIAEENIKIDSNKLESLFENAKRFFETKSHIAAWAMGLLPNPMDSDYNTPVYNTREVFYMAVIEIATK